MELIDKVEFVVVDLNIVLEAGLEETLGVEYW